jgi:hypothetical protein
MVPMKWYDLTDKDGKVLASIEAKGKKHALEIAQETFGGIQHTSAFIRYLRTPEHGALHIHPQHE